MAARADEIQRLGGGAAIWFAYEPEVKVELFASALTLDDGSLALIDPIPLADPAWDELTAGRGPARILLTNSNHARAADALRVAHGLPVFSHPLATGRLETATDGTIASDSPPPGLEVVEIPGAPEGEVALWQESTGTLVLGDALIHIEGYGFTFLPDKYARNPQLMRRSLRALCEFEPRRILFAHGFPIVERADARLRALCAAA